MEPSTTNDPMNLDSLSSSPGDNDPSFSPPVPIPKAPEIPPKDNPLVADVDLTKGLRWVLTYLRTAEDVEKLVPTALTAPTDESEWATDVMDDASLEMDETSINMTVPIHRKWRGTQTLFRQRTEEVNDFLTFVLNKGPPSVALNSPPRSATDVKPRGFVSLVDEPLSRVNDPVYGMVELPEYVQRVMVTPLFQRLGRVRQLGNLAAVWPSATHTRLEHSIGAAHLAMVYAKQLDLSDYETRVFVLASLLHDIAHGPRSHCFEQAIAGTPSENLFGSHDIYRHHLLRSNLALREAVSGFLGDGDFYDCYRFVIDDIVSIWLGRLSGDTQLSRPMIHILHTLLAGVAGVDRMDYILRDLYHTNPQRRLDYSCIQSIILETSIDATTGLVTYSRKGERFIQHFLEMRNYLYREVYFHPRAISVDQQMVKAIRFGFEPHIRGILASSNTGVFEFFDDTFLAQLPNMLDLMGPKTIRGMLAATILSNALRGDVPRYVIVPEPVEPDNPELVCRRIPGVVPDDLKYVRFGLTEQAETPTFADLPDVEVWFRPKVVDPPNHPPTKMAQMLHQLSTQVFNS